MSTISSICSVSPRPLAIGENPVQLAAEPRCSMTFIFGSCIHADLYQRWPLTLMNHELRHLFTLTNWPNKHQYTTGECIWYLSGQSRVGTSDWLISSITQNLFLLSLFSGPVHDLRFFGLCPLLHRCPCELLLYRRKEPLPTFAA